MTNEIVTIVWFLKRVAKVHLRLQICTIEIKYKRLNNLIIVIQAENLTYRFKLNRESLLIRAKRLS